MFKHIDAFLNKITMYRLMVYYLGGLLGVALILSFLHILAFSPLNLLMNTGLIIAVCWLFNALLARLWNVPTNAESALITALILALIIDPDMPDVSAKLLVLSGLGAMLSKYLLSIRGKHIFNPAALGLALPVYFLNQSATWWVGGNAYMIPLVVVGGYLIVRKLRRHDLLLVFLATAIFCDILYVPFTIKDISTTLNIILIHSPILFFAFAMLTEPLTSPPQRLGRLEYGGFVGFLFAPWVHVGSLYFTPELALCAGNILSYIVSPKYKVILKLQDIKQIAADTYEYIFVGRRPSYKPGQYAEWTIDVPKSDARGNRRFFTIASSPTELNVRLGVKFYRPPSSFKLNFAAFHLNSSVLVGNIGGDFTLPWRKKRKLAFMAGGIGITPFRSMVKYMVDKQDHRDVVLLYANKTTQEIAYRELFDALAKANTGFRVVYTLTDRPIPGAWQGEVGVFSAEMIKRVVPDYRERLFYISGPHGMVDAYVKTLRGMGVSRFSIKTDYFPGFA